MENNSSCSITVKLSEKEKRALQECAAKQDLTMSQIVRRALKEFLEKQQ